MSNQPKLLFLAYYFPPVNTSGSIRSWNIAKYLARCGWKVTVVTPHPALWRRPESPERVSAELEREGIGRILTGHRWRVLAPDYLNCWNANLGWLAGGLCRKIAWYLSIEREIGWDKEVKTSCSTLAAHQVDLVFATGTPFSSFRLAKHLADRFRCPYVLDYRDSWTQNPHVSRSTRDYIIDEERRLLAGSRAVTMVSHSLAESLDRRFCLGSKLHVIPNGYDREEMQSIQPYHFGHFAMVYAGTFYPPKRVITPVMHALKLLDECPMTKARDWRFHYYGPHRDHVREEAERLDLLKRVVLHGPVSRSESLSAVRGADLAVVITSVQKERTPEDSGIVTAKIFEALGLRVPILLIAPPKSDVESIIKTAGLAGIFAGDDIQGIVKFLQECMDSRLPQAKDLDNYAWENIVKSLDHVLRLGIGKAKGKLERSKGASRDSTRGAAQHAVAKSFIA